MAPHNTAFCVALAILVLLNQLIHFINGTQAGHLMRHPMPCTNHGEPLLSSNDTLVKRCCLQLERDSVSSH
jgi:hypothetical protein